MRLTERKLGWIGIDIGTSTVKIAQVERGPQGWGITASAVVPRQQTWQEDMQAGAKSVSSLDELQAARSLQQGYRGRSVAATLPMSLCDVHRLDRDLDREPNAMQILREAIETATQRSVDQVQCDCWSAPQLEAKPAWTQAITVPRNWTDQLCEDVSQAGWSCEAIDGLPLAMTRAVRMIHSGTSTPPLAALDWGSGRATLCFIENGQPSYVRCLKDCGLRNLLDSLIESLQVTELEAQRLLEEIGFSAAAAGGSDDIARLIQEISAEPMSQLIEEIKRSIAQFQYLTRAAGPEYLYLLGGGAMIKDVETQLSSRLKIEARNWQLPAQPTNELSRDARADCLLASAVALSALAWEAS